MKKVTFTVAQLIFLIQVNEDQGFNSTTVLDMLGPEPENDVEVELSEEDIADIAESVQWQIDEVELSEEDLATANEILVLLGVLPEEPVAESQEVVAEAEDQVEEVDDYPGPDKE